MPTEPSQYAIYPSLRNKTVVITGGAEGIGGCASELFAAQGSKVIILDIATASAEALISKISASSDDAPKPLLHTPVFYHCDVTDLARLQAVAAQLQAEHGAPHVLINNAAGSGGAAHVGTFDVTPETWEFNVNVNLRHHFFLTQYLAPAMRASGRGGSVINMGSISWRIPATGLPVYTTCKAAVRGLTRTLARELGEHNIRVNSVMPGAIATQRQIDEVLTDEYKAEVLDAQALKTILTPAHCARLLLFLASDDAFAVTGSSYVVDGGWVGDP